MIFCENVDHHSIEGEIIINALLHGGYVFSVDIACWICIFVGFMVDNLVVLVLRSNRRVSWRTDGVRSWKMDGSLGIIMTCLLCGSRRWATGDMLSCHTEGEQC